MHLCIERKRARAPHLFQPPACGHHSQGSLQQLGTQHASQSSRESSRAALCRLCCSYWRVQPMAAHARQLAAQQGLHALSTPFGQPAPFMHCHADDITIHGSLTQCRQASWVPPRQGRQPPSGRLRTSVCRRQAGCLPGAVALPACASARPPWEVLSVPALAGTRPPCPDRWTPSETPQLSLLSACQPLPSISCTARSCKFYFFLGVKKAYMPVDANHISNPKDR